MTSKPIHYLSLMGVSARLRSGELKPTALTEMILARIARRDGTLKSYTTLLADRAMATARVSENELNRGLWREKSQIQALDRTQPGLPLKPGRCSTMTRPPPR